MHPSASCPKNVIVSDFSGDFDINSRIEVKLNIVIAWTVRPQKKEGLKRTKIFIIQVDLDLYCRDMAQAFSRQPFTAETGVRSQVSPCQICGGESVSGTGPCPGTPVSPCQYRSAIAPYASSHLHAAVTRRTNGRSLGTFQNAMLYRKFGERWIEKNFHFFLHP